MDASDAADFDDKLSSIEEKWDRYESSCHPRQDPQFFRWFVENKAMVIKSSMIVSIRESVGLGSPPQKYTTNSNESMNSVTKAYVNSRRSTWSELNNAMYNLVED